MLSSTSSSDTTPQINRDWRGRVWSMVALLAGLAIFLEVAGSWGFVHLSRIQRRMDSQYQAARRIQSVEEGKPTLLVVGNSLLLEGLNMAQFKDELSPAYAPSALFIEQTNYYDWLYGLRRLFHEGARPKAVLLGLGTNHLVDDSVRGEYFAHFLMDVRDLPAVARQENLSLTTASSWLLANWSGWLGAKAEVRSFLLGRTMPGLYKFTGRLLPPPRIPASPEEIERVGGPRFRALKDLCEQNGARFFFVVPPNQDLRDAYLALERVAAANGVPAWVPYPPGTMPAANYADGFHLNATGAALFSHRLAESVRATANQ